VVDGEAPFAGAVVEGEEDRPGQWNLFQYTSHVTASKGQSLLVIDSTAILLSRYCSLGVKLSQNLKTRSSGSWRGKVWTVSWAQCIEA